jgi:hypothetical protein
MVSRKLLKKIDGSRIEQQSLKAYPEMYVFA